MTSLPYDSLTGFEERRSPHYRFHFRPHSTAAREIEHIVCTQEDCYTRITAALQVSPDFPLHYILLDAPEEAGVVYERHCGVSIGPLNGFACFPDTVVAVYNERVQCIGMHEDTHLIAQLIGNPCQGFIIEGLAMYMDGEWWSEPNERWVQRFLADGRYIPIPELISNDRFYAAPSEVSYPIAGAFTRYLTETLTFPVFLREVYAASCDADKEQCLPALLGKPMAEIEADFLLWIAALPNLT